VIYSDGMTEVNGNGKRETGKARARRVMAEKLAEARKRIEQDEADLGVVLDALDQRLVSQTRRDVAVREAQHRHAQACGRADEDAAVGIVRWLGRGATVQAIADATEMPPAEVSRLRKLGDKLNAERAKPDQAPERDQAAEAPAERVAALVGVDTPTGAAAGQGHALAEAEQRRAERDASDPALNPGRGTASGPADVEG